MCWLFAGPFPSTADYCSRPHFACLRDGTHHWPIKHLHSLGFTDALRVSIMLAASNSRRFFRLYSVYYTDYLLVLYKTSTVHLVGNVIIPSHLRKATTEIFVQVLNENENAVQLGAPSRLDATTTT